MKEKLTERKTFWLAAGTLLGLAIAYYCPEEPAYADSAASGEKFSMCTVNTIIGQSETVFVLDHLTGRLVGGQYSNTSNGFVASYTRNIAADFKVVNNAQYVMVPGQAVFSGGGNMPPANGAIYIGELNSGIVAMYGYNVPSSGRPVGNLPITPVATFPWRAATP